MSRLLALSLIAVVLTGAACTGSSPTEFTGPFVRDFAIGDTAGIVVSLNGGQHLRSTDDGRNWVVAGEFPSNCGDCGAIQTVLGKDDSIWIVPFAASNVGDTVPGSVAVSRDLGASFSVIPVGLLRTMVGRPSDDPLILAGLSSSEGLLNFQFWTLPAGSADTADNLVPFGPSTPESGFVRDGSYCGGQLFMSRISFKVTELWRWDQSGNQWIREFSEEFTTENVLSMTFSCDSADGTPWAKAKDGRILSYDSEDRVWTERFDLRETDVGSRLVAHFFAVNESQIVVIGAGVENRRTTVLRFSPDGSADRLPSPPILQIPTSNVLFKAHFAPDGSLWVSDGGLYKWNEAARSWDQRWP